MPYAVEHRGKLVDVPFDVLPPAQGHNSKPPSGAVMSASSG
jgi:hypothetical protein